MNEEAGAYNDSIVSYQSDDAGVLASSAPAATASAEKKVTAVYQDVSASEIDGASRTGAGKSSSDAVVNMLRPRTLSEVENTRNTAAASTLNDMSEQKNALPSESISTGKKIAKSDLSDDTVRLCAVSMLSEVSDEEKLAAKSPLNDCYPESRNCPSSPHRMEDNIEEKISVTTISDFQQKNVQLECGSTVSDTISKNNKVPTAEGNGISKGPFGNASLDTTDMSNPGTFSPMEDANCIVSPASVHGRERIIIPKEIAAPSSHPKQEQIGKTYSSSPLRCLLDDVGPGADKRSTKTNEESHKDTVLLSTLPCTERATESVSTDDDMNLDTGRNFNFKNDLLHKTGILNSQAFKVIEEDTNFAPVSTLAETSMCSQETIIQGETSTLMKEDVAEAEFSPAPLLSVINMHTKNIGDDGVAISFHHKPQAKLPGKHVQEPMHAKGGGTNAQKGAVSEPCRRSPSDEGDLSSYSSEDCASCVPPFPTYNHANVQTEPRLVSSGLKGNKCQSFIAQVQPIARKPTEVPIMESSTQSKFASRKNNNDFAAQYVAPAHTPPSPNEEEFCFSQFNISKADLVTTQPGAISVPGPGALIFNSYDSRRSPFAPVLLEPIVIAAEIEDQANVPDEAIQEGIAIAEKVSPWSIYVGGRRTHISMTVCALITVVGLALAITVPLLLPTSSSPSVTPPEGYWCGSTWLNAGSCKQACVWHDDCPTGQLCFKDVICGQDEKDREKVWCGATYQDASSCLHACPGGSNSECPENQLCFADVECVLGTEPLWCGTTFGDAASCTHACPSGSNAECPNGQTCFAAVQCSETEKFWCGATFEDATSCTWGCPRGGDSSCPNGQKCFSGVECSDTKDTQERWCGSKFEDAASCTRACPSGTNAECLNGQSCHTVVIC